MNTMNDGISYYHLVVLRTATTPKPRFDYGGGTDSHLPHPSSICIIIKSMSQYQGIVLVPVNSVMGFVCFYSDQYSFRIPDNIILFDAFYTYIYIYIINNKIVILLLFVP